MKRAIRTKDGKVLCPFCGAEWEASSRGTPMSRSECACGAKYGERGWVAAPPKTPERR